jgi:hypothetical protein
VWAHFLRQKELEAGGTPYSGPAEELYRRFEATFEARFGPIVSSYWCSSQASCVVLTVRRRPGIIPDVVRLHWATDWSTRDQPTLKQLMFRCETLAIMTTEVLRDTSKRLAVQRIFNSISYVLGFAESEAAHDPKAVAKVVGAQTKELDAVERYYKNAAVRSGQIIYLGGTLMGVLPFLALAAVAAVFGAFGAGQSAIRTGAVCFAAGAVGALVSVMSRMSSNKVSVDWEFGRDTLRTLGSLRPFVGGVFGLMTYFALQSGLLSLNLGDGGGKSFYFYVVFSFVSGFSERLAQDMLLGAAVGKGISKRHDPEPPPTSSAVVGEATGD